MSAISELCDLFRQFYGAYPLTDMAENIEPGVLLDTRWEIAWPLHTQPRFLTRNGMAHAALGLNEDDFRSELINTNLMPFEIEESSGLAAEIPLGQIGLTLKAGFKLTRKASLMFTEVKKRRFEKDFRDEILMPGLYDLKKTNPPMWESVKSNFLVLETLYATKVAIRFSGDGSAEAELSGELLPASAKVTVSWANKFVMNVEGLPNLPFAVKGLRV